MLNKSHDELIPAASYGPTDWLVGVRDNGDGSFSDYRYSAAQVLAFVTGAPVPLIPPTLSNPAVADGLALITGTDVIGAQYYEIQTSTNINFTGAASVNSATWPKAITGLTNGAHYYFRSRAVGAESTSGWSNTVSVTPAAGLTYAYIVAKDTNLAPTEGEFLSGTRVQITPGSTSNSYDLSGIVGDKFIFIAEPIGEPTKTYKFIHAGDQELLSPANQFNTRQPLTVLAYYASNFATSVPSNPLQLKTTA